MPIAPTLEGQPSRPLIVDLPANVIALAIVLLTTVIFLLNTRYGIGILPDSTRYMALTTLPYDAPLYPWLLSVSRLFAIDIVDGAKVVGLLLVAANAAAIWTLLLQATRSRPAAAIGTLLVTISPQFVALHSSAMSEPLFLFLMLAAIFAFLRYLSSDRKVWLMACAMLVALDALTRFTAPALGAAIAVCLLLNPRHGFRARAVDALAFGLVSGCIFLGWVAFSEVENGHSIGRQLHFFGNMGPKEWLVSLKAMTAWLLPDEAPLSLRVAALCTVLGAAGIALARHIRGLIALSPGAQPDDRLLTTLLGLFFLFYLAFMVLSTSIEANLYLNGRYAFPAYVALVLMLTIAVSRPAADDRPGGWLTPGFLVLAVLVICSHSVRTVVRTAEAYRSGIGYASVSWKHSPTIAAARRLAPSAPIHTNAPDLVGYALRRTAYFVPQYFPSRRGVEDPANPYDRQIAALRRQLANRTEYVVFFDHVDWRFYLGQEAELVRRLDLRLIAAEKDGRIYESNRSTGRS